MIAKQRWLVPLLALSAGLGAGASLDAQGAAPGRECYRACDLAFEDCLARPGADRPYCMSQYALCYSACDDFPEN